MINEGQLERSLERVSRLYLDRQRHRDVWWGDADKLRITEARLCAELLPLVAAISSRNNAFHSPVKTFVDASVRLLAGGDDNAPSMLNGLLDQQARPGVMDALCLCAEEASTLPLVFWYHTYPELHAPLLELWTSIGTAVDKTLIKAALINAEKPDVQVAALGYLATQGRVAALQCRGIYGASDWPGNLQPRVTAAACRAGLLSGDGYAVDAAMIALEHVSALERGELLRTIALSTHADAVTVLCEDAKRNPLDAARLLAIHGGRQALLRLPEVLDGADPVEAEMIAYLATGDSAPRKLDSGSEGGAHEMLAHRGGVDGSLLEKRIMNRLDKEAASRWMVGEPLNQARLTGLAKQTAGTAGQLLVDRLALEMGNPCQVTPRDWVVRRDRRLVKMAVKRLFLKPAPPARLVAN